MAIRCGLVLKGLLRAYFKRWGRCQRGVVKRAIGSEAMATPPGAIDRDAKITYRRITLYPQLLVAMLLAASRATTYRMPA